MRVLVTSEERFSRTPDGKVWSSDSGSYSFWTRYLAVFNRVRVLGRVDPVREAPPLTQRADGESVSFEALPYYVGPIGYARNYLRLKAAMRNALTKTDAVILRAASPIANCAKSELAAERPFGVEVIGDPYEVFAPGSINHPMRPLLRYVITNQLKRQCQHACAVAYVSGSSLVRRYPPQSSAFTTTYSSIVVQDSAFVVLPRAFHPPFQPLRIVSVGTLDVPYKGFDVLIDAVSKCVISGLDIQLVIVGDGRCRESLERHAQHCGVERIMKFAGRVSAGAGVRDELDHADLFVLASKTEGLPRAMIEAMARGLPCIGSAVGGIPELLGSEELVPRGDAMALALKINEVCADPHRMTLLSVENLAKARGYHDSILSSRRRQFFAHVQEATLRWSQGHPRARFGPDACSENESMQAVGSR